MKNTRILNKGGTQNETCKTSTENTAYQKHVVYNHVVQGNALNEVLSLPDKTIHLKSYPKKKERKIKIKTTIKIDKFKS